MAARDRNLGWPGFFRVFTVLCAIMLLTCWSIPALFLLWGMFALDGGKPHFPSALLGLALPAFCLLVFWGAVYAVVAYLLGGGTLTPGGVWGALVAAARGDTYFHLWPLYPLVGLYLVHPVVHRFTSPCGAPSTRTASWRPSWSASGSIWCWAGWGAMWPGGICGTTPSAGWPSSCCIFWGCWGWC